MKLLLDLFLAFARVGVMTFGGGYAMIPILEREIVDRHGWATEEELMDYYAVGQCTPGVIAVNTSTYVGFLQGGALGAVCATLGVIFPSLLIISALASIIRRISHFDAVRHAFAGIRVAVSVLVLQAKLRLWKKGVKGPAAIGVWLAALVLSAFFGVSAVWLVGAAIVAGLVLAWREAKA